MIKVFLQKLHKKTLFKDASTYALYNTLDKIVPFLIMPLITRFVDKSEFGIYVVYQAFVAFVLPIISLNTDSAILINYFKISEQKFKVYFYNAIFVFIISLIVFSVFFFSIPDYLSDWLEFPKEWLWAILVISSFTYFHRLVLNLWQVEKKAKYYGRFSITLTLLRSSLMILFVVILNKGWEGIITSQLIAYFIIFIASVLILRKRKIIVATFDKNDFNDVLKVGIPLTFHQLGGWMGNQGNRIILNSILGTAATGSFGVGALYGTVISVLQNSFNKAFVPYLFEKLKNLKNEVEPQLVRMTYSYNLGLLLISLIIGLIGYYFNDFIFGSNFTDAKVFIIWLTLGNAFNGLYKMHVNYIFFTKKTYLITYITFSTGLLNIVFSYFLIVSFGAIGVAYAFLLAQFISYIFAWYLGNKSIKLPWFSISILKGIK